MILARKLVFVRGRNTLPGEDIELCVGEEGKPLGFADEGWTRYLTWKETPWNEGRSLHLSQIFIADKLCTDPRDNIFALLGICRPVGDLIIPNYNLPVEKVFQQAVLAMVNQDHGNLRSVFRVPDFAIQNLGKEKSLRRFQAGSQTFQITDHSGLQRKRSTIPRLGTVTRQHDTISSSGQFLV